MQSGVYRCYTALLVCLAAVLLACPGCGGKANVPAGNQDGNSSEQPGDANRNVLQVHMPPVQGLAAGAEFVYSLDADFVDALYQGCGRVLYDASVMKPVAVTRGAAIPGSYVFAAKLDAPPMAGAGNAAQAFVPFAFTGLPGQQAAAGVRGELLQIRFRLLTQAPETCNVTLLNNSQYLQLRSPQATRLPFDLQVEVAAK